MKRASARRAAGFVMQELLIALIVIALVVGISIGVYATMRSDISAEDQGNKVIELVSSIQKNWRNAGSFTTVTGPEVNKLALIKAPMRYDGTNIIDAWGNNVSLSGGTPSFAVTVGGATNPMDKESCATVAQRVATIASNVRIGSAATVGSGATAGQISGGNVYKNGATITQTGMTDGCNETGPIIAAQFR